MRTGIVIPLYNEVMNVRTLTEKILKHTSEYDAEIVFVNDGSKNGTSIIVDCLAVDHKGKVTVVHHEVNKG